MALYNRRDVEMYPSRIHAKAKFGGRFEAKDKSHLTGTSPTRRTYRCATPLSTYALTIQRTVA